MIDVQAKPDDRNIAIDRVGVSGLRYPVTVLDRNKDKQNTVAAITMSVDLPHHFKGTHMSRFIEILNKHHGEITIFTMPEMLRDLRSHLQADRAQLTVAFPYFIDKAAPVSNARAIMDYECWFWGEANGKKEDFVIGVDVPVTSLCPCSKEISDYGAHNQRGKITIEIRSSASCSSASDSEIVWIEELIEIAENAASSPVYPLLKRPDERYVTMAAYDKPVFVEDMVRDVASSLKNDSRIDWFNVKVENQESIHNHNAFASVEWKRLREASVDLDAKAG